MKARSNRIPLLALITVTTSLGAAPLRAQRAEATRRAARPESAAMDSAARQLRRLQAQADSLARLYNETTELAERRRVGLQLDATVDQIEPLLRRLADLETRSTIELRFNTAPFPQAMLSRGRGMPRGWLGIVVSGAAREPRVENGELIIRYLTHPEIVSVEPSSPAERAGLAPSDTLIAYDGQDVRDTDISLTRLLRPNSRVLVRIRRDGRTRDVPVTIAAVPSRITVRREEQIADAFAQGDMMLAAPGFPRVPPPPATPYALRAPRAGSGTMSIAAVPPTPAIAPVPPLPPMVITLNPNGVAGAELGVVSRGWARTLGVRQGLIVLRAPVGSFAAQSGLQDADVIVKVNGQRVLTVGQMRDLVQAASEAGERSVELDVVRDRKTMRMPLRW